MHTATPSSTLDFSSAFSFHRTKPIPSTEKPLIDIPEQFYDDGYTVIDDIASPDDARMTLEQLVSSIDKQRLPLYKRFADRVQLASETCIPTCTAIVETTFQGLHFDMGLPIISPSPQVVQLLLALYRPMTGAYSQAATRVVSFRRLLSQRSWMPKRELEERLIHYAQKYGDGWKKPYRVNTFRLACCARFIDAIDASEDMAELQDVATGLEFRDEGNDEQRSLQNEYAFFAKHGLDVPSVEEQVRLEKGQLLIVDNIRAAHGRIGKRQPQEMWHYLFGVPSVSPEDIDLVRQEMVAQFAK